MFRFISKLKASIDEKTKIKSIDKWYEVSFDDLHIYRHVAPPKKEPWDDNFAWSDIEKVCFECTDYMFPDNIYFFVKNRPESYLIPNEAKGAHDLWNAVLDKGLFDLELATKAMSSVSGVFCHPPNKEDKE